MKKWFALIYILWMFGFFWFLGMIEDQDRGAISRQAQMTAALEIISKQCLTGEGVTPSGRGEACKLVNEAFK